MDDLILNNVKSIWKVKGQLQNIFEMKNMEELQFFLDIEMVQG